jgi:hypothetical protein
MSSTNIHARRLKDKAFVWYEFDKILNLGFIGPDLVRKTRFHPHLEKLWEGALDVHASRRDMLVKAWFDNLATEIEKAHEAWEKEGKTQPENVGKNGRAEDRGEEEGEKVME